MEEYSSSLCPIFFDKPYHVNFQSIQLPSEEKKENPKKNCSTYIFQVENNMATPDFRLHHLAIVFKL